jgi:HTH-type transcriptional regulator/antitoxin HigA
VAEMMIAVPERYALKVGSPTPITSERQHEQYLSVLDKLASKDNPTTEEEKYAEVLMTLIEAYEAELHSIPDASPLEVLRTLMDANDLRQKDMVPIFGSESIVSEVLHKKRDLNKTHIEKLSKRFNVSPAVFFQLAASIRGALWRGSQFKGHAFCFQCELRVSIYDLELGP